MIGTNLGDSIPVSELDRLITLLSFATDVKAMTESLEFLRAAKIETDASLSELNIGKSATAAFTEAKRLSGELKIKLDEAEATAKSIIAKANADAEKVSFNVQQKAAAVELESVAVAEEKEKAKAAIAEAKLAQEKAAAETDKAKAEVLETRQLRSSLELRIKEINEKVASL